VIGRADAPSTVSATSTADTIDDFVILPSLAVGLFALVLLRSCLPEAEST
jgi:hypothetical protein